MLHVSMLPLLLFATTVVAHGYVDNATIDGEFYQFYQPYGDPYWDDPPPRISRKIPSNGPVENVSSIDLQCGGYSPEGKVGSAPAPLHAPVTAGSVINLRWTGWPDSHMGPLLTYMARCPDTGCDEWLPDVEPVFFKVDHDGRHGTGDDWASTPLMFTPNHGYNFTIPSCLKPGYYLVRHEIIALHSAWAVGGAQFYPSCFQLRLEGDGNIVPVDGLVSFPGEYKADDPGIFINAWNPGNYTIPGPDVWRCPDEDMKADMDVTEVVDVHDDGS